MSTQHTPAEALESLVRDLNATYWSSWQSTAKFSDALRDAELVIQRERMRDAAPEMLTELRKARAALKEQLDILIQSHTCPTTGLITDDTALLVIESDQDLINSIDATLAKAEANWRTT